LDGYPRTYTDAQYCFLKKEIQLDEDGQPMEDDEEEELEEGQQKTFEGYIKDMDIFPSSCIVLEGKDSELIKRVRELPEDSISGTHYNSDDMQRRLKSYRLANNSEVADPSVSDFFREQGI